jgi:hypothetical protein
MGLTHLAGLVLGDLVLGVLPALLALAVGLAGLGNVDLSSRSRNQHSSIARRYTASPVMGLASESGHCSQHRFPAYSRSRGLAKFGRALRRVLKKYRECRWRPVVTFAISSPMSAH